MQYYKLKYTDNIKDGFGGLASMWKIKILNKYKNDVGRGYADVDAIERALYGQKFGPGGIYYGDTWTEPT